VIGKKNQGSMRTGVTLLVFNTCPFNITSQAEYFMLWINHPELLKLKPMKETISIPLYIIPKILLSQDF